MHALIPVKRFEFAKQRLAGVLTPEERAALVAAMLEDVLAVVGCHPALTGVLVVSDEPAARQLARRYQVGYLLESALGASKLNGVVRAAVDWLGRRRVEAVMVLHADLPLMTAAEISVLTAAHKRSPEPAFTVVPDRRRDGSNCLLCPPGRGFEFRYGRGSFLRHMRQAAALGTANCLLDLAGASFDVDWPRDLEELLCRSDVQGSQSRALLQNIGLERRLPPIDAPGGTEILRRVVA